MSFSNFFSDLISGNFTNAESRFLDWWNGTASPELKSFLGKVESSEGQILEGLVSTAAQDVVSGGFTTASFVAAGKDVLAKLLAENISTFNLQYVIAALNIKVAPLAPPIVVPSPVPAPANVS